MNHFKYSQTQKRLSTIINCARVNQRRRRHRPRPHRTIRMNPNLGDPKGTQSKE